KLVLSERLSREEVHGACARVVEQQVEDRQVIAQGLAAGRRSNDDHVTSGVYVVERLGLVRVKAGDASGFQDRPESRVDSGRDVRVDAFRCGLMVDGADGGIGLLLDVAEMRYHRLKRLPGTEGELL